MASKRLELPRYPSESRGQSREAKKPAPFGVLFVWLLVIGTAFGMWADDIWPLEWFAHFRLHYLVVGVLLAVWMGWLRQWRWLAVCLLMLWLNWLPLSYLYSANPAAANTSLGGTQFTVVQWNLFFNNRKQDAIARWLRQSNADLVALQEVHPEHLPMLETLRDAFPHQIHLPSPSPSGMAVLSRNPVKLSGTSPAGGLPHTLWAARAEWDSPAGKVALWLLHPPPPMDLQAFETRAEYLQTIPEAINYDALPKRLMIGDLNTTPFAPLYHKALKQSGQEDSIAGQGYQGSWPSQWMVQWLSIPIDHVWFSRDFKLVSRLLGPATGSDHQPVIVTLVEPPQL